MCTCMVTSVVTSIAVLSSPLQLWKILKLTNLVSMQILLLNVVLVKLFLVDLCNIDIASMLNKKFVQRVVVVFFTSKQLGLLFPSSTG